MNKSAVVLQTDFGLDTGYPSSMHGVICGIDPEIRTYDLNHQIRNYDIRSASASLQENMTDWPAGTVFVSVVDPGVGTARKACVAKLKTGYYIVTPDNGTLNDVLDQVEEVRQIDEKINRRPGSEATNTFHGRDIFAYCGGRLAAGIITWEQVGPVYPLSEIVRLDPLQPAAVKGDVLECVFKNFDTHFGSTTLNLQRKMFEDFGFAFGDTVRVRILDGEQVLFDHSMRYDQSFGAVAPGELIFLPDSNLNGGQIEAIAVNKRSFMRMYLPEILEEPMRIYDLKIEIRK